MKQFRRVAVIALFALIITACTMPEAPRRTALIYGVSIYDVRYDEGDDRSVNLTFTDDDAEALASMLESKDQEWSIKLGLADTQVSSASQDATRAAIQGDIASLTEDEKNGLVLFYFSGHGGFVDSRGESVICQYDSFSASGGWLYDEMISASELYAMFENAGLKNVVVILDSCNSGGFVEGGATVDAIPPLFGEYDVDGDIAYTWFADSLENAVHGYLAYTVDSRYVALSAAGMSEPSWESGGHGIFTAAILGAMDGSDADIDADGYVDTGELYAFCAEYINTTWNSSYQSDYDRGQYIDYFPHLSGTAREYALWATD